MQTLFTSDRMILEGKIYYAKQYHDDKQIEDIPHLFMKFIFQVNGKFCIHQTNFELAMSWDDIVCSKQLWLKNFEEWYKIESLFESMGYSFKENRNLYKWILMLLEDEEEPMPWRVIESVSY